MKPATKKLAPYVPQPWAIKMLGDLAGLVIDPSKQEQCIALAAEIKDGRIS